MRALGPASGVEKRTLLSGPLSLPWIDGAAVGVEEGLGGASRDGGGGVLSAAGLGMGWERRRA